MTARRMKAMRFDKDTIKAVSRLVELHLRFHGYGGGEWTDSAVRRYVTDAGPLLPRLHRLTRSDCTTRNVRKARSLSRIYDDLETRIARLLEQEQLDAVRPELDGNEIAEVLGIPGTGPGPRIQVPPCRPDGAGPHWSRGRGGGPAGLVDRAARVASFHLIQYRRTWPMTTDVVAVVGIRSLV